MNLPPGVTEADIAQAFPERRCECGRAISEECARCKTPICDKCAIQCDYCGRTMCLACIFALVPLRRWYSLVELDTRAKRDLMCDICRDEGRPNA